MQIMLFIIIVLVLITFLIYKINKKFGQKEFFILVAILIIPLFAISFLFENNEKTVPEIFKQKYEKDKKIEILKFSYERLNNKDLSTKTNFIYNFDYIIKKGDKEFVCSSKKVKIKKIEDEYIFENFDNLNEKCSKK